MTSPMWKQLDQVENRPARLTPKDRCFYARDYASGKDYSYSEANSLIKNFKKSVSKRGTSEWHYKEQAIKQFANELFTWLGDLDEEFFIAAIPPSKRRDDPEFDSRLDTMLTEFERQCQKAHVVRPVERATSMLPAHISGSHRPTVEEAYESLSWTPLSPPPTTLVLVDDVITAGTTYKACQRLIEENAPELKVYGVFWARTIWPDDPFANVEVDLSAFFD